MRLLALSRGLNGLRRELLCRGRRWRSLGRGGTCHNAVFLAPRRGRRGLAAFTPFAAIAAAATAALAIAIAFTRLGPSCMRCRRATVLLRALLP